MLTTSAPAEAHGGIGFSPVRGSVYSRWERRPTQASSRVFLTHARNGTGRIFVVEQPGRIKVVQSGSTTPSLFLDISSRVVFGWERGLLGLAFPHSFMKG